MRAEQLDRLEGEARLRYAESVDGDGPPDARINVSAYVLCDLIADYRRLRELDRACRDFFSFDEEGDAYPPSYAFGPTETEYAAQVAIGRLLEGEKPTIEDIGGSDPDFTGGKRTEDYVREMREGGRG